MQKETSDRPCLLLVEDEPSLAILLTRLLDAYRVQVCTDGLSAKMFLVKDKPDVIICDVGLPDTDGARFYDWLALQRPELCKRLIFTTGGLTSNDLTTRIQQTRRPVLAKPFHFPRLLSLLSEVASA